jgi:hypothetical protein
VTSEPSGSLDRRAVRLPVNGIAGAERRALYAVAGLLEREDLSSAEPAVDALVASAEQIGSGSALRAGALARTMLDLARGGWDVTVDVGHLYVSAPKLGDVRCDEELMEAKRAVRGAMGARVRDIVSSASTARLLRDMEPEILQVIARPERLAQALIASGAGAVRPYLQAARPADGRDLHSGVPLYAIFRYLRFLWSFPAGDTPGRSLPVLIRDAGQPGHPVCGLLCFASPVLRLTARDDALGLTGAWLEALVAALDIEGPSRREGLAALERALRDQGRPGLSPGRAFRALARLLALDADGGPADIARRIRRLPDPRWDEARAAAARRVALDLCQDLSDAIGMISFEGLGITREAALADPAASSERLGKRGERARAAWERSRKSANTASARSEAHSELLFAKKRSVQLAALLAAWDNLQPISEAAERGDPALLELLRGATSRRRGPFGHAGTLEGGARVSRGLSDALLARKVSLASSRIADVSLCGAVPPYDGLLGGKLAALLALSSDAARLYREAYEGVASEIQSRMAGEQITRSADLVALTTTSLYGVGSSQYNRLTLPPQLGGLAWEEVGETAGHGTMHFSTAAVRLLGRVGDEAKGVRTVTGTFGEGPSERLRRLRDGLHAMGLPANELIRHGMSRISYVAAFQATHPGAVRPEAAHGDLGPSAEAVAQFWRERWLSPRLEAAVGRVQRFRPGDVLLSERFPAEIERARAALAAALAVEDEDEVQPVEDEDDEHDEDEDLIAL